jgi:hypothetical protein
MASALWIAVIAGCESEGMNGGLDERPFFDHAELHPIMLSSRQLSAVPAIGKPSLIRIANGTLWLADRSGDPGLHALDPETGALRFSVGRRGEGPGEFARSPFSLTTAPNDGGAVWAFDLTLQRLTRFEPVQGGKVITVPLQGVPPIQRVVWVTAGHLIGQANSDEARFSIFAPDGSRQRVVAGALLGSEEQSRALRLNATNSAIQICAWPERGFAIVYFFLGRIEFHDMEGRLVRIADVPFPSDVRFEHDAAGNAMIATPRQWYIDCTATSDLLFALFSGRLRSAFEGDSRFSGEFVHVFGWDGSLRAVFQLDSEIRAISVDSSARVMYAGSLVDARILRYPLPGMQQ